jgi:hypothetical protein
VFASAHPSPGANSTIDTRPSKHCKLQITCDPDLLHPTVFDLRQTTLAPSARRRASLLCAERTIAVASHQPVKIRGRPLSGPWQHVTGPLEPPKPVSFRVQPTTRRLLIDQIEQGQAWARTRVPGERSQPNSDPAAHKSGSGNESRSANLQFPENDPEDPAAHKLSAQLARARS